MSHFCIHRYTRTHALTRASRLCPCTNTVHLGYLCRATDGALKLLCTGDGNNKPAPKANQPSQPPKSQNPFAKPTGSQTNQPGSVKLDSALGIPLTGPPSLPRARCQQQRYLNSTHVVVRVQPSVVPCCRPLLPSRTLCLHTHAMLSLNRSPVPGGGNRYSLRLTVTLHQHIFSGRLLSSEGAFVSGGMSCGFALACHASLLQESTPT